jgi:hypothetical protein
MGVKGDQESGYVAEQLTIVGGDHTLGNFTGFRGRGCRRRLAIDPHNRVENV